MPRSRNEDAQSFLLRFWYERSQLGRGHWRGAVWRDQAEHPVPVAGPDEAFAFIRAALEQATPEADKAARPPQRIRIADRIFRRWRRNG